MEKVFDSFALQCSKCVCVVGIVKKANRNSCVFFFFCRIFEKYRDCKASFQDNENQREFQNVVNE